MIELISVNYVFRFQNRDRIMVINLDFQHVFKYPVETVAETHLTKYPHEKEKNVIRMDTMEKKNERNGIEYHRRIAMCLNVVPNMLRRIGCLNTAHIFIEEQAWIDRRQRMLTLKSKNITWAEYAYLWEESVFRPFRDNPHWTTFEQKGVIDVHGLGAFGGIIELFAERFIRKGMNKSLVIMEEILKERATKFTAASEAA